MEEHENPRLRRDLEFIPVQQGNEQFVVIMDSLGLVAEGKAVPLPLYEIMALLDGTYSVRDIQMILMRQKGGVLIGSDEVERLLAYLDTSFVLETETYRAARDKIAAEFSRKEVRPCSHCGRSYPAQASNLKTQLNQILESRALVPEPDQPVAALIAPHIDFSVGARVYGGAYQSLRNSSPSRVLILGVGHQMTGDLFCLTQKDFQTPLGLVRNDREAVQKLVDAGHSIVSDNDFVFKSEHSVEFQVIFLQHLLEQGSFTIVPILCGSFMTSLSRYNRDCYLEKAGPFLKSLSDIVRDEEQETIVVAGIDFSHIGPKFGHEMPATYLESRAEAHDRNLLKYVSEGNVETFWEESMRVEDQFNVCGFSAMACLMEILPPSKGQILDYQCWHEEATRSAVSFAAVVFTKQDPR